MGERDAIFGRSPAPPYAGNLVETEATARTGDRITLRVVDLGLQHHVDDDFRHTGRVRESGSLRAYVTVSDYAAAHLALIAGNAPSLTKKERMSRTLLTAGSALIQQ